MHEIGHTLGLRHGGFDDVNYKPNYPSIMNYGHLMEGGLKVGGKENAIDYSRLEYGTIDSREALDESVPLTGSDRSPSLLLLPSYCPADGSPPTTIQISGPYVGTVVATQRMRGR